MDSNIPKIIHYGWFGGKKKSKLIRRCMATWKKNFPDYEIREWNEQNFDLGKHPFAKEAYDAGKFAFVSDYVRVYVIYHLGGVYFDTDIEVRKNFSSELEGASSVFAFELQDTIMTGFFASEKKNPFLKQLLDYYDTISFYDDKGDMRITPNPVIFAEIAKKFGVVFNGKYQELSNGMRIYPNEVFGGYNVYDMVYTITDKTLLVHHCTGTWRTIGESMIMMMKKGFRKIFGTNIYRKLRNFKQIIYSKKKE